MLETYPGGKNGAGVYQAIINQIPPHRVYIEPFVGSGAVLRRKRPAAINIGLDLDPAVIKSLRCGSETGRKAEIAPAFHYIVADANAWLKNLQWAGDEFVYCDPPYLAETRRGRTRRIYAYEMMDRSQHVQLLDLLSSLPCMVMISGYQSALYDRKLRTWRTLTFQTTTRGSRVATECLWMNYPEPLKLHDYRYLGENYRKRQDFKRMKERWTIKLINMPALKRSAIISAIEELETR